ncbi:NADH dehydrogenase [ubiquinone] 1 beta subcomplex subunit 11, mitochondrial, partial [Stegodyphus mimosarum]
MAYATLSRLSRICLRNVSRISTSSAASISTSKKNKDTLVYPDDLFPKKQPPPPRTVEDFAETKNPKSWISYGFDENDYEEDRFQSNYLYFLLISVLICGGTFLLAYAPDFQDKDWIAREARLELHRRETLGLPLVDKNYIDPEKIVLPTDEELGDTEIII